MVIAGNEGSRENRLSPSLCLFETLGSVEGSFGYKFGAGDGKLVGGSFQVANGFVGPVDFLEYGQWIGV